MEQEFSIEEKVGNQKAKYVPVSIKVHQHGDKGYVSDTYPWQRFYTDKLIRKGQTVYVVTYIQHSGKDENSKVFFDEKLARRYIDALGRALVMKHNSDKVEVHYNNGVENLHVLLEKLPVNTYVNFRTPTDEYSITLAKTIY